MRHWGPKAVNGDVDALRSMPMKRTDLLKAMATLPVLGGLLSSPVATETEETAGGYPVTYQFAQIEDGSRLIRVSETYEGEPTFEAMKKAGAEFFNHVWRYVYRDGVRHVDSMVIHR